MQAINKVSVLTPFSLVCAALLTYPCKGVYRRELLKIIQVLYDYLKARNVPLADSLRQLLRQQAVEETLALCEARKLQSPPSKKKKACRTNWGWGATASTRPSGPFWSIYKNNIIHFFLPAAIVSLGRAGGVGLRF